jgi:methionine-rich copper-binding protein CopC
LRKNYTSTAYTTINATNNSPTNGIIVMSLTAVQTAALKSGRYVYDLQIAAADGTVTRVIEGVITFRPEVTK